MNSEDPKLIPVFNVLRSMIPMSKEHADLAAKHYKVEVFEKKEFLSTPGKPCESVYFVNNGLLRVMLIDNDGNEQSLHFGFEHQFVTDFSSFITGTASDYYIQSLENTEVVILPRESILWSYENLPEGNRLARYIAEHWYVHQDQRIKNIYLKSPKERYDSISKLFPGIHQMVPQHMIASYLGISAVHLSRLKKADLKKS